MYKYHYHQHSTVSGFLIYESKHNYGYIKLNSIDSVSLNYDSSMYQIVLIINDIIVYKWDAHLKYEETMDAAKRLVSKLKSHLRIQPDEDFNINDELN